MIAEGINNYIQAPNLTLLASTAEPTSTLTSGGGLDASTIDQIIIGVIALFIGLPSCIVSIYVLYHGVRPKPLPGIPFLTGSDLCISANLFPQNVSKCNRSQPLQPSARISSINTSQALKRRLIRQYYLSCPVQKSYHSISGGPRK